MKPTLYAVFLYGVNIPAGVWRTAEAVESALAQLAPAMTFAGVVGRPDADCGETPCAFVVLRPGNDKSAALEAELCGHVAERLTKYKQPREVRFVSGIPRNPSGKILRRELRAKL